MTRRAPKSAVELFRAAALRGGWDQGTQLAVALRLVEAHVGPGPARKLLAEQASVGAAAPPAADPLEHELGLVGELLGAVPVGQSARAVIDGLKASMERHDVRPGVREFVTELVTLMVRSIARERERGG